MSPDDLKNTINAGLQGIFATASWPTYDGKTLHRDSFLTASEATKCPMQLYFDKTTAQGAIMMVADPPPNMCTGVQLRGHVIEDAIVNALMYALPERYKLVLCGSEQRSFYSTELDLSGTPDGGILDTETGRLTVLEFKSFDPRSNISEARPAHVIQLQQNAGLIRHCWNGLRSPIWFREVADVGFVIYVNANDLSDVRVFRVLTTPGTTKLVLEINAAKAAKLFDAIEAGSHDGLEATGVNTGDCKWCSHQDKCPAKNFKPPQTQLFQTFSSLMNTAPVLRGNKPTTIVIDEPARVNAKQAASLARQMDKAKLMQQMLQSLAATPMPIPAPAPVEDTETKLVDRYVAIVAGLKDQECEKDDWRRRILDFAKETGATELFGTTAKLAIDTVAGRESFDYKGFLKVHPFPENELTPFRKKGAESVRVTIHEDEPKKEPNK